MLNISKDCYEWDADISILHFKKRLFGKDAIQVIPT